MNASPPPKRRRLRAPLEPDLPGEVDDDPRSGLRKSQRSVTAATAQRSLGDGSKPQSPPPDPRFAELHCLSAFSFQRGASNAAELFERARDLGYAALAITDECSIAGIVRALEASEASGVKLIVGSEVQLADGPKLVLLVADAQGYSDLCRLITTGRRRSAKGEYRLLRSDVERLGDGVLVLWPLPAQGARGAEAHRAASSPSVLPAAPDGVREASQPWLQPSAQAVHASPREDDAAWIARHFGGRAWIAVELHRGPADPSLLAHAQILGARHGLPLVAAGDVHMHLRRRRALQDVMTAIRLGCSVAEAGHALFPNGERHLRRVDDLERLYPPELLAQTLRIAERCRFQLRGLDYEYPHELAPTGTDRPTHLRTLVFEGAARRFPQGIPPQVRATLEKELALIQRKRYEAFFLTVHDIVRWAREERGILCQGRGSSANSAVCYCLGITAVNPAEGHLLFERFLSDERDEPPDIDVDFEHERREEVLQYVFAKYGRERAAIAATVISYRGRSAVRDVGRALGIPDDQIDGLARLFSRIPSGRTLPQWLEEHGFDPGDRSLQRLFHLAGELRGFPRHLSQHVGGFVISEHPLHTLVPVENAAMAERTIIQWDKDDLETMKLLKVDCLALGMLTCLRKCFDLMRTHHGVDHDLASIPRNDEETYGMIRAADTVGVFQIESRAQMSMLPRLKPRTFYDLVIEVAIVRPGPIQGDMVHPYLERRRHPGQVEYESAGIERVLGRTLGIPIFQEQVMELLQVAADFTPGEADQLRRSMAAWKRRGGLEHFHDRIFDGMKRNGYSREFAERIYRQIQGFGEYGFPESHAYSFALLAYASSWLKRHYPAVFTCALLNSQPMGFYQPAQLVQDLRQHRGRVLPADVTASDGDCTLEAVPALPDTDAPSSLHAIALRLGLHQVRGLPVDAALRIVEARREAPFRDVADLTRRAKLKASERARLADAGALASLSGDRHRARWDSAGAEQPAPVLAAATMHEAAVELRAPSLREDVMTDYATLGLSLRAHPLALVRTELARRRVSPARLTTDAANRGRTMRCAGLVTVRQHPGTAKGVTFVTLEDETGIVNVVVWRALAERQHRVLLESTVMAVDGVLEASEGVHHLIAKRLHDYSTLLPELGFASRDFH
jgi:error-prone DNA polymerase